MDRHAGLESDLLAFSQFADHVPFGHPGALDLLARDLPLVAPLAAFGSLGLQNTSLPHTSILRRKQKTGTADELMGAAHLAAEVDKWSIGLMDGWSAGSSLCGDPLPLSTKLW